MQTSTKMNNQKVHALLGHNQKETIQATKQSLGWTITQGALMPCEACTCVKTKEKNINKKKTEARR